jgi:hypothetical protein
MELRRLSQKLIKSAQANPPADTMPYAFEQRIMAHIREAKPLDAWAVWSAALWRAAFACLVITILSSVWTIWGQRQSAATEFAQEFESVVMSEPQFDDLW